MIIAVMTSSSSEEKLIPLVCLSMKLFQDGMMKQKLHVIRYARLLKHLKMEWSTVQVERNKISVHSNAMIPLISSATGTVFI